MTVHPSHAQTQSGIVMKIHRALRKKLYLLYWHRTLAKQTQFLHSHKLLDSIAMSITLGACALAAFSALVQEAHPATGSGGATASIHGIVAVSLPANAGSSLVPIPNVTVTVMDATSPAPRGQTVTTLTGRFVTPLQPGGTYRVCAKTAGFAESCSEPVTIVKESVALKQVLLLKPQGAVLSGNVRLKDGSPGSRLATATHTTKGSAQVSLADVGGHIVAGPVSVNAFGSYVLPTKPGRDLVLSAHYEEATISQTISLVQSDLGAAKFVDLVLPSSAPVIQSVTMTRDGKPITIAAAGSTIVITLGVKDEGPGVLHYRYSTNSTGLAAQDGPLVTWKLPATSAADILFFEVSNGRGGVLRSHITVPVQAARQVAAAKVPQRSLFDQARNNTIQLSNIPAHSGLFIDPAAFMGGTCTDDSSSPNFCGNGNETENYYNAINAPTTFKAWKNQFGFSADPQTPGTGLRTTYYNNGDLQFGRDMHCNELGAITACYVSNYGDGVDMNPGADPQTAIGNASANQHRIVTVAMTSQPTGPPPNGTDDIQFFVYGVDDNDENDGPLQKFAALDHEGGKAVPGVCMACHGGHYDPTAHKAAEASFLPFDTPSFIFSTTQPSLQENAQRDTFRGMNLLTIGASGGRKSVTDLIFGWYSYGSCSIFTPGCGIDDVNHPFYPSGSCSFGATACGWPSTVGGVPAQPFYQGVPRRYCRTCHVALSNVFDVDNFAAWQERCNGMKSYVLGSQQSPPQANVMPYAEVPYDGFWHDSSSQAALGLFLNAIPGCE